MSFHVEQVQAAVFLSAIDKSSRMRIAMYAAEAASVLSGVDPALIPLPDDVPQELPQVQIINERTGWTFQYAPVRLDLLNTAVPRRAVNELPQILHELEEHVSAIWASFSDKLGARSSRIGLVITLAMEIENSSEKLRGKYLNPEYGEGAKVVQVHYLKNETQHGFTFNHWVRILNRQAQQTSPEMIILQFDVNTVPEAPLENVSNQTIQNFFNSAREIIDGDVSLHTEVE
jgi:hypothetical protein